MRHTTSPVYVRAARRAEPARSSYAAPHLIAVVLALVGGLSLNIKQVDLGAKGTWYRLRIAAGSKTEAATLCAKLTAESGACIPTK